MCLHHVNNYEFSITSESTVRSGLGVPTGARGNVAICINSDDGDDDYFFGTYSQHPYGTNCRIASSGGFISSWQEHSGSAATWVVSAAPRDGPRPPPIYTQTGSIWNEISGGYIIITS